MVELASGFTARVGLQLAALLKKNVTLSRRNVRATFLQIGASFFFMVILLFVDFSIRSSQQTQENYRSITAPVALPVSSIPRCTIKGGNDKCLSFVFSPKGDAAVEQIVRQMRVNNDPEIPEDEVEGFTDRLETDKYLLKNPETVGGAIHFLRGTGNESQKQFRFQIQTNSTVTFWRGTFDDANFAVQVPLQNAAHRETARYVAANHEKKVDLGAWDVAFHNFAHPQLRALSTIGIGTSFFFAATMFGFVIQCSGVVAEKENKLRLAMKTAGLLDSAYWLSWYIWEFVLVVVSSLFISLFGMLFNFNLFIKNDFGTHFFLFFTFQLAMLALALLLSAFLNNARSATILGFVIFLLGFIIQLVVLFGYPYGTVITEKDVTDATNAKEECLKGKEEGSAEYVACSVEVESQQTIFILREIFGLLFPPALLAKGLGDLESNSASETSVGLRWSEIGTYCQADSDFPNTDEPDRPVCVMPLESIYAYNIYAFLIFSVLLLWCDNVVPDSEGVCRPVYYFLLPSYWGFGGDGTETVAPENKEFVGERESDVAEEEQACKARAKGAPGALALETNAAEVRGLWKSFGSGPFASCGSYRSTFDAVKDTWFDIPKNQLFCLLGPNGAGKTTTINMLTGVLPTSAGDAILFDESIATVGGMDRVRRRMGVCPQFDILWPLLTGVEHIELFAAIKGMRRAEHGAAAARSLEEVELSSAGQRLAGDYSGGMRRRLSVAISLIGDPDIVFLDEPTTGMDPISRTYVWKIIERAKMGRAVVLTTHSMEEADILGDRIAIMCKGRMRCIGSALHLKLRYGAGYSLSFVKSAAATEACAEFKGRQSGSTGQYDVFTFPREVTDDLPDLFKKLGALGVSEIQLKLTTLETVFLNIAAAAEYEEALKTGKSLSVSFERLTGDHALYKITAGVPECVLVLGTGEALRLSITWSQDDSGNLEIDQYEELERAGAWESQWALEVAAKAFSSLK